MQTFNLIHAILNIVLDILFIPHFGIMGAAYGTLLSFVITSIIETLLGELLLRKYIKLIGK